MRWKLDEAARQRWKQWLKNLIAEQGQKQSAIAEEIAEAEQRLRPGEKRASKTTALNDFIDGKEATLRKWFEERPAWVDVLAEAVGLDRDALQTQLAELRDDVAPGQAWHPEFPDVALSDVEIPAPLSGPYAPTPTTVATALAREAPSTLYVVGRANRAREIAIAQIRKALADTKDGKRWQVEGREDRPETSHRVVTLAPWGATEIVALAERLASRETRSGTKRALTELQGLLGSAPAKHTFSLTPDLAVRLVAGVARDGCPKTTDDLRQRVTEGAWRRATESEPRLAALQEPLLADFFAALARRTRGDAELGPWHQVPRAEALAVLRSAATTRAGAHGGKRLEELAEALGEATPARRASALEAIRAELATDAIALGLEALVAARILEPVPDAPTHLRATSATLAALWASRGLGGAVALRPPWGALLDPAWGELVSEQARAGLAVAALRAALQDVPPGLRVDADLVMLRFALATSGTLRADDVLPAWASVLWAILNGYLDLSAWRDPWGWRQRAEPVVRAVTRRYRRILPRLGEEPLRQLNAYVPPPTNALVSAWRGDASEQAGFLDFQAAPSPSDQEAWLLDLAAELFVADTPERWDRVRNRVRDIALARVIEEAEHGDPGCGAMLSGATLAASQGATHERAARFLCVVPWDIRVTWAARCGPTGPKGAQQFVDLLNAKEANLGSPKLLEIAARLGADELAWACERTLLEGWAVVPKDFALQLAEHLRMIDLLEHVAALPFTVADGAAPRLRAGTVQLGDRSVMLVGRDTFRPFIALGRRLAEADATADAAARALYRLGRPSALVRRWMEPGPHYSERILVAARRIEALAHIACVHPFEWRALGVPLEALAACAGSAPAGWRPEWVVPAARAWAELGGDARAFVQPIVFQALEGLRCLLHELPDDLPPAIEAWLSDAGSTDDAMMSEPFRDVVNDDRVVSAARALLDLGDDGPLDCWIRCPLTDPFETTEDRPPLEPYQWAADGAVRARLEDLAFVARAWDRMARDPRAASRPLKERWLLLHGSRPRTATTETNAVLPLRFVSEWAKDAQDSGLLSTLTHRNGTAPTWLPVIESHLRRAADRRSRAWWALIARTNKPSHAEAPRAIREWLMDDPSPWSGGKEWYADGFSWVGGTGDLLDAALASSDPALTPGLRRLFLAALELEHGDEPSMFAETGPPTVRLRLSRGDAPWPIAPLAAALAERGQESDLLGAWRDPPAPCAGDPEQPHQTRHDAVRRWLRPWWLKYASSAELREHLWNDGAFALDIVEELGVRRGEDVGEALSEAAVRLQMPRWALLARLAPERLLEALRARLEQEPASHVTLSTFLSTTEEAGAFAVAAAAREAVARLADLDGSPG